MPTGTVKWFSEEKGYGFITPDEGGPDLFVHYTGIADGGYRTLAEGAGVEFEVREGRKGMEAFDVMPTLRARPSAARREGRPPEPERRVRLPGRAARGPRS